jgi:hypothetical protein
MSARVRWEGLDAFLREFGSLPEELQQEGLGIVREETEGAAVEIATQLPRRRGVLAGRVRTFYPSSSILVGLVQLTAPHAHLFHFGSKDRRTDSGANRGRMPGKNITVPVARRRRARMARRLVELLRRKGFQVGHAE